MALAVCGAHTATPAAVCNRFVGSPREAFRRRDFPAIDALALKAYGLETLPDFEFVDTRR